MTFSDTRMKAEDEVCLLIKLRLMDYTFEDTNQSTLYIAA